METSKQPIAIILNNGAGKNDEQQLRSKILEILETSGREFNIININSSKDFLSRCDSIVRSSKQTNTLVVAAGGDGTINAIATLCYKYQVTLGIIPLGTFNYFARNLLIPTDISEAVKTVITGAIKPVSVGLVQDKVFLNNASFGFYTKMILQREEATSKFGRIRIVAAFSTVLSLLKRQKIFTIKINSDGHEEFLKVSMVFVGNNTLQLENLGLDVASCTSNNKLGVIIMKRINFLGTLRILWHSLIRNLTDEPRLRKFCSDNFTVETKEKNIKLVIDGEIINCDTPLHFRIEKNALNVITPLATEIA